MHQTNALTLEIEPICDHSSGTKQTQAVVLSLGLCLFVNLWLLLNQFWAQKNQCQLLCQSQMPVAVHCDRSMMTNDFPQCQFNILSWLLPSSLPCINSC